MEMEELKELIDKMDTRFTNIEKGQGHIKDEITAIKTALTYDGTGLIPKFMEHCNDDKEFKKEYYTMRRWIFILVGIMLGSEALTVVLTKII